MAGAALSALGGCEVVTAGTLTIPGQPMSWRTRDSLAEHGLAAPAHRSTQCDADHLAAADLVVGLAAEHVQWVRREFPHHAHKAATLKRLVRDGVTADLAAVELDPSWEDVEDPGGGELPEFQRAAAEVVELVGRLHPVLVQPAASPGR
jgi:protein-tyrosine-phosphatase